MVANVSQEPAVSVFIISTLKIEAADFSETPVQLDYYVEEEK